MPISVLTKKGQTTIPKDVRKHLNLKPQDKIIYLFDGDRVILKALKGNILDLRGTVPQKGVTVDFEKVREETKKKVARKIVERTK